MVVFRKKGLSFGRSLHCVIHASKLGEKKTWVEQWKGHMCLLHLGSPIRSTSLLMSASEPLKVQLTARAIWKHGLSTKQAGC